MTDTHMNVGSPVRARKDLFWSDGENEHLHAHAGDPGIVVDISVNLSSGGPHVFVKFENGEARQTWGDNIKKEYELHDWRPKGKKF
jgi:hypothetical protein